MARTADPTTHPIYGTYAHLNSDAGDHTYAVAGSDMPLLVVEVALHTGRSVDEIVSDPAMRCTFARKAVQGIADIMTRRMAVAA